MSESGKGGSGALAEAPRAPQRRWMTLALIASLALNALFVGIALRAAWQFRNASFLSVGGIERRLPRFVETLPADRRDALREAGAFTQRGELRQLRKALRQARSDTVRAFTGEPFSKQQFIDAEARLAKAEADLRQAIRGMLPELGERLTADERRALLRWSMRGRGRHYRRGGRRGGPDDPPRVIEGAPAAGDGR